MKTSVSLVNVMANSDLKESIRKAFELINFQKKGPVETVIIKPNLNYYWDYSTGATTDPQVVGSLIDYVREQYGEDIHIKVAEADATAMKTKHAFQILGYNKLAEKKGIELVNLCLDDIKKERINVNGVNLELDIPQSLVKADLFINVPKLKTIRITKITCAMKNLFGCLGASRKFSYHPHLEEAIIGVNKLLHPHVNLVDGLVGLGRYPIRLNLLMASANTFSIDWAVAKIAGFNPRSIKFLKLSMKEKLGNPYEISLIGEDISYYKKLFPREGLIPQSSLLKIMFPLLRLYKKVSGDIIPPFLEET